MLSSIADATDRGCFIHMPADWFNAAMLALSPAICLPLRQPRTARGDQNPDHLPISQINRPESGSTVLPQAAARPQLQGPRADAASRARGAIVCLTKGYADMRGYDRLIERNRSVHNAINRYRTTQYPLIVWHEGNVTAEQQNYILCQELNSDVRFTDVSSVFQLPAAISPQELAEDWPVGYRLMCRFHSYHVWQYSNNFDYVMRLDEDCTIISTAVDPIEWIFRTGIDFATCAYVPETHRLTNCTLPRWVERYIQALKPHKCGAQYYNQVFPYTNCYVTRTDFWLDPAVQHFLYSVANEPDFIRLRWGDLPVLGTALNIFSRPDKVRRIPNLVYKHASHNTTVHSPDY
jgi:hypothetical protein